jgi:hypothetical protein
MVVVSIDMRSVLGDASLGVGIGRLVRIAYLWWRSAVNSKGLASRELTVSAGRTQRCRGIARFIEDLTEAAMHGN